MSERHRYRARYVIPVDRPPLENATLEIEGERIVAIHDHHDPRAIDLGNVALIPGLVNAHVHLEFSDLDTPIVPPQPFTQWLRGVMHSRSSRTASIEETLKRGIREVITQGTAVIGEVATHGWSAQAVADENTTVSPLHIVAFRELLTLSQDRIPAQLNVLEQHLHDCKSFASIRSAVSPHAPYSVHPELFSAAVNTAKQDNLPLAIHLAETSAELELMRTGTGEFREFLGELGVWQDDVFESPRTPLDYLKAMSELDRGLIIHGNYLTETDIQYLAAHQNLTVIYCPRTHAYFGHSPHPWKRLLNDSVAVALGTDGRSSNPNLSVWEELRFLYIHHPDVPPATILQLGTINGAKALGIERDYGTITPGKKASIAVIELPKETTRSPEALLFDPVSRMRGMLSSYAS
ncbi:MAG: amidohydrolase family protein [Planctomycetota bacterium]|nr:amidohydrolase family protein [Planctomycetota bacterium]MDA1211057.1 amidohydrolase family protein [Planctomycetota bacterium]